MYNQLYIEEYDYDFDKIINQYFNNCFLWFNFGYIGDTLGKYNIIEVPFIILKKDVPI